jgi:CheY-like chemotaxis protein
MALTASAMAEDGERFLSAGMDGYLAKPFRGEELNAAVSQAQAGGYGLGWRVFSALLKLQWWV